MKDGSKTTSRFLCIVNAWTVQTLVFWVNQGICHLCSVANTKKIFRKLNLETKNQLFGLWKNIYRTILIYGKILIGEFSYNFLYVWNCVKFYDKKFFIYGNGIIRSFGQPGSAWSCDTMISKFGEISFPMNFISVLSVNNNFWLFFST